MREFTPKCVCLICQSSHGECTIFERTQHFLRGEALSQKKGDSGFTLGEEKERGRERGRERAWFGLEGKQVGRRRREGEEEDGYIAEQSIAVVAVATAMVGR